ncbi:MAG: N-acetyltransferase [Paludibacteraceae bacterium]|nr:N-acetyltransferase [Paludibacteraceae bacterium]
MIFEEVTEKDFDFIVETYNYYIKNSTCIYFTNLISTSDIKGIIPFADPIYKTYIVKNANQNIGFCYFKRFQHRQAFDISVEIAIYLSNKHTGKGYGQKTLSLLEHIISKNNFKNIIATVNSTNTESKNLFERNYYKCVGKLNNIAEKFNQKLTLLFYQKEL